MPNPSHPIPIPMSQFARQANSSTEILSAAGLKTQWHAPSSRVQTGEIREVSLLTGLCERRRHANTGRHLVSLQRERNESVDSPQDSIRFSNRKDRQKGRSQPLLKAPNPAGIVGFIEGVRHRCATPDEQVMDRDAERVAGGSDAI